MNKWIYHYYYFDTGSVSPKERGSKSNRTIYQLARKRRKEKYKSSLKFPNTVAGLSPSRGCSARPSFHLHLITVAGVILQSKTGFWSKCKTSQMDFWLREVCADVARGCSVKEINYRCLISHLPLSLTALHYGLCIIVIWQTWSFPVALEQHLLLYQSLANVKLSRQER